MATTTTLKLTFGYQDSDFRRTYELDGDAEDAVNYKARIKALNASLTGGQVQDMKEFFVADDGSYLDKIVEAKVVVVEETPLGIGG